MSKIDDLGLRINRRDYPFHDADEWILISKICGECDQQGASLQAERYSKLKWIGG